MRKTDAYRTHHEELRAIAGRIETLLHPAAIQQGAEAVAAAVRELFGKLSIHLALEDNSLYPRYVTHADLSVADAARRFQREMGGLGEEFDRYKKSWPGPLAIARDPAAFVGDTMTILGLLKARVAREETQLYDLIDRAK